MPLIRKTISGQSLETYLYYPGTPMHSPFKRVAITILRESADEESVKKLLAAGLEKLAEEKEIVLSFPNPPSGGWNAALDPARENHLEVLTVFQNAMDKPDNAPVPVNEMGIPTVGAMLSTWHLMHDTRYFIGIGAGASMVHALAAKHPESIAGLLTIGGSLAKEAENLSVCAPVPAYLVRPDTKTAAYYIRCNKAECVLSDHAEDVYINKENPCQCVVQDKTETQFTQTLLFHVWDTLFSKIRRTNTGSHGDCAKRTDSKRDSFQYFIEDSTLTGTPQTWFVHVPAGIPQQKKVPLMVFFHGGSDNPAEAAEMSRFHELGEQEGFITVYPWGSNRASWNSELLPGVEDDLGFSIKLLDFMLAKYPVDPARVYLSGFSNGAAMAQTVAMVCPERIAAICPVDSNWPGTRSGASDIVYADIVPIRMAMAQKRTYDYRMPVWYTYGTREISYPVYKGCSQQHQYDFWKWFNHIAIKPTPPLASPEPAGCGVKGDGREVLYPSKIYPHHFYTIERFFTSDKEPKNYYNYVVMHDKGHEVAEMDCALGWRYVKQFKRNSDGSVGEVGEQDEK